MQKSDYINKIIDRAEELGIFCGNRLTHIMDIVVADKVFHINFERWLEADDYNFLHDFAGIYNNIDRANYNATHKASFETFNCFVPRFSEV